MPTKVIFLTTTGAGTWTVPADWTTTNTIECIGGGGGGRTGTGTAANAGGGGGGGGYGRAANVAGLSGTLNFSVGTGGGPSTNGGDTWFNGSSVTVATVSAQGGRAPTAVLVGGVGGSTATGIGPAAEFNGGTGGVGAAGVTGGGGGGAAGPGGVGGNGGGGDASTTGADFGGGGGGSAGSSGTGGLGGTGSTTAGVGGTAGTGGGLVGGAGGSGAGSAGGNTPNGTAVWTSTHLPDTTTTSVVTASPGAGGGGGGSAAGVGGAGSSASTNTRGYGGGGGGTGSTSAAGTGSQGLIIITYTTSFAPSLPLDKASFTFTGKDAAFVRGRQLLLDKGSLTFTGRDLGFIWNRPILLDKGSFTFTGKDALLVPTRYATLTDVSAGGWTNETGGTTLAASVDEATASDTDYIQSTSTPAGETAVLGASFVGSIATPLKVKYRIYKKAAGAPQSDLVARLKQGTTTIATWTHTNVPDTPTLVEQTLTGPEFASVTDPFALTVELEADSP